MVMILMAGYYFVKVNATIKLPNFLKAVNCFLVVLTLYGVVYMMSYTPEIVFSNGGSPAKFTYLKELYVSILPIYLFYYFGHRGELSPSWIRYVGVVLLLFAVFNYFKSQQEMLMQAMTEGRTQEEFTNNIGYTFCAILPLLFFWRFKPLIQYVLLLVCVAFIVMAMKRGAILISALCVIYFLKQNISNATKKQRRIIVGVSLIALIVGSKFVIDFASESDYFQSRIETTMGGGSSGRDIIFTTLWNYYFTQTSNVQLLFGCGANYTIAIAGNYAHNDWLELLINQGVLGVILYLWYFFALYGEVRILWSQKNNDEAVVLTMALGVMFMSTLFSMSYASLGTATVLILGYCLGRSGAQQMR